MSHRRDETERRRPESPIKGRRKEWVGPEGSGLHVSDKCNHKSPALPVNNHLNWPIAADDSGWKPPGGEKWKKEKERKEEGETRYWRRGKSVRQRVRTKNTFFSTDQHYDAVVDELSSCPKHFISAKQFTLSIIDPHAKWLLTKTAGQTVNYTVNPG